MDKEITETETTGEIVVFDPSLFEQDAMQEKLGQDDLALPFLKVLSRQDPTLDDLPCDARSVRRQRRDSRRTLRVRTTVFGVGATRPRDRRSN